MPEEFSIDNDEVSPFLWAIRILSPILVGVGTVGNTLIVAIYTRVEMRKTTAAVYLGCLAIADTMCLYTGLMRGAFFAFMGQDIVNKSTYLCKTVPFFQFTFQYLSAWILVAFTIERCLVMWQPLLIRPSRSRAAVLVGALFNVALITNIFFLAKFDVILVKTTGEDGTEEQKRYCRPDTEETYNRYRSTWPIWNIVAECVVPTLLLMICNIFIILGVERHKTTTREYEYSSETSITTVDATHRLHPRHIAPVHTAHTGLRRAPLFLIIIVNVSHIILTAPRDIFYILFYTYPAYISGISYTKAFALRHCLTVLGYGNNALNFPLYCVTRRDFRHAAHVVLHRLSACCRSDPPPNPFLPRRRKVNALQELASFFKETSSISSESDSETDTDSPIFPGKFKLQDLAKEPYIRKPSGSLELLLWQESVHNLQTMGSSLTLDSATAKRWNSEPRLSAQSLRDPSEVRRSSSHGNLRTSSVSEQQADLVDNNTSHRRALSAGGPRDRSGPLGKADSDHRWASMSRMGSVMDPPGVPSGNTRSLSVVEVSEEPLNSFNADRGDVKLEGSENPQVTRSVNTS